MSPDDLRVALLAADGEAVATCLAALDDPSVIISMDSGLLTATANLLTIYRRRASHVRKIGLPTLGFDEVVQRLEATPHTALRLACLAVGKRHPWCVLFIAPDRRQVVATLAVTGTRPSP